MFCLHETASSPKFPAFLSESEISSVTSALDRVNNYEINFYLFKNWYIFLSYRGIFYSFDACTDILMICVNKFAFSVSDSLLQCLN